MSTEAIIAPAGSVYRGPNPSVGHLLDEDLVRLAQHGCNAATERLVFVYRPLVRSLSNKFYVLGAEREDVIQEGFVGLFRAIRSFSLLENSSFRCFANLCITRQIQTAVRNACRSKHDTLNQAASLQIMDLGSDGLQIGNEPAFDQDDAIRDLLSEYCVGLTEFERTVLSQLVQGKSYSDIGKVLGCDPKSVDNGIQRAKRKIMLNRTR